MSENNTRQIVQTMSADDLVQAVQDAIWQPVYPDSVS
jgi:hypothetical protein